MTDPVELLILMPPTLGGGLERSTMILLSGFDRARVRPTLVLTHTRDHSRRLMGALPEDVELLELGKRGFADQRRVIRKLRALYEDRRPGAIMTRATYAGILAMLARRGTAHQPAVILTEHVTPSLMHQPANLWLLWAARRYFPRAEALVGVGRGVAAAVRDEFRMPPDRVHVIENSFDPDEDRILADSEPLGAPFDGSSRVVLFVGRLSQEKGVDDLVRAMAIVRRSIPARLVIIGDGPERAALERLAGDLAITESVEFAGYVAKPFRQMAAADVMVVPSRFEAFALVMLEGMRAGAAIVAADCDWAPREIIRDGQNGLLVGVRDPDSLAAGIRRVLDDSNLAAGLRHGARASSDDYSPQRNIEAHQRLIAELVAGRPASHA